MVLVKLPGTNRGSNTRVVGAFICPRQLHEGLRESATSALRESDLALRLVDGLAHLFGGQITILPHSLPVLRRE